MDLHCHDCNSDVTDELLGRILRFPETWLKTDELSACLKEHGCDLITITNHNNARSCWELMEAGEDVLPGAEFTCFFKKFNTRIHVLAYGFTPAQEESLNRLRNDLPSFLTYATDQDIPTILPHPLYVNAGVKGPDPVMYEHLALMFDRFEVLNGQRDVWQNLLTWEWLDSLTEERIDLWQKNTISGQAISANLSMTSGSRGDRMITWGFCRCLRDLPVPAGPGNQTKTDSAVPVSAGSDSDRCPGPLRPGVHP